MEKNKPKTHRECIMEYLQSEAEKDPMFKEKLDNPNKSIEECERYIYVECRKYAIGGCAAVPPDVVHGMAKHYYDEDDIKIQKMPANTNFDNQKPYVPKIKNEKAEKKVEKKPDKQQNQQLELNF